MNGDPGDGPDIEMDGLTLWRPRASGLRAVPWGRDVDAELARRREALLRRAGSWALFGHGEFAVGASDEDFCGIVMGVSQPSAYLLRFDLELTFQFREAMSIERGGRAIEAVLDWFDQNFGDQRIGWREESSTERFSGTLLDLGFRKFATSPGAFTHVRAPRADWIVLARTELYDEVNRGVMAEWTEYICALRRPGKVVLAYADIGYPYGTAAGSPHGAILANGQVMTLSRPVIQVRSGTDIPSWADAVRPAILTMLEGRDYVSGMIPAAGGPYPGAPI